MVAMDGDAIRLSDVRRHYGRVRALDGVNLSVARGEVYGFLGPNGAGKTTTMRVLMGIVRADGGSIELLGERVTRVSIALKRRIGYVSQEQYFYPWMSARQLGRFVAPLYPSWDEHEYQRLLALLDVPPDRRSVELSGGTRTKLGLALALAPRPALLLLDEPTTGLDPVARAEFNELVIAMVRERGTTALFSSHLVGEIEGVATRVGIIQAGKMRVEGDIAGLRARVRRLSAAPVTEQALEQAFDPPPGFVRVRADVWQAEPELWATTPWPEGTRVEPLSLEQIFLAFARTDA